MSSTYVTLMNPSRTVHSQFVPGIQLESWFITSNQESFAKSLSLTVSGTLPEVTIMGF